MLKQRVITAVLLLAVLAAALTVAAPVGFPILAGAFVACSVWEWMRLLAHAGHPKTLAAAAMASAAAAGTHAPAAGPTAQDATLPASPVAALAPVPGPDTGLTSWPVAAAALVGIVVLMAIYAGSRVLTVSYLVVLVAVAAWLVAALRLFALRSFPPVAGNKALYGAAGLVLPLAAWVAVVAAAAQGLDFMLSILALVWVADIAAYFSGKAFGKHKLAPAISPGKTWEGVVGAVVAVWIAGMICAYTPALGRTFPALLSDALTPIGAVLVLTLLVALSIVGDLFESHLKRQGGIKDSSNLLPGHGGVLDRIDALLPVVPAAMLIQYYLF